MPLQIIRQDITKIKCDAVVNPTNTNLNPTGGTDLAIHKAAGKGLLDACKTLGDCMVGEAKITPAFKLPCKYVIHTVGPVWNIDPDAEDLLCSCYNESLYLAKEHNCESVAFPLISSGTYGFPKDKVLKIALDTISDFLFDSDIMIYLVVYDSKAYELSKKLFTHITEFIDDHYIKERKISFSFTGSKPCAPICECKSLSEEGTSLDNYIKLDKKFAYKLFDLIEEKGLTTVEAYKKANVSKQTWHKIETDKNYKPNKKTVISFAVALELTLEETQNLLRSVGFILSESSLFDIIIMYCLENRIYNILEIDSILFQYDQETLYSKA